MHYHNLTIIPLDEAPSVCGPVREREHGGGSAVGSVVGLRPRRDPQVGGGVCVIRFAAF